MPQTRFFGARVGDRREGNKPHGIRRAGKYEVFMDFSLIFSNLLQQLLFTVGIIVIFGFITAIGRRGFSRIIGPGGDRVVNYGTGFIGTPVHELSHALACVVFGHKIVEMRLYSPNSGDGSLGYVNHSYNPKNLYHRIGNFFIGIAPILGGSAVLLLLMRFMVPAVHVEVMGILGSVHLTEGFFSLSTLTAYLAASVEMILAIFNPANLSNVWWWVFVILAIMISSHMELSGADIKGSVSGVITLALLFLAADCILSLVGASTLLSFTATIMSFGATVAGFLVISLVFSLILLLVALVVRIIRTLLGR